MYCTLHRIMDPSAIVDDSFGIIVFARTRGDPRAGVETTAFRSARYRTDHGQQPRLFGTYHVTLRARK